MPIASLASVAVAYESHGHDDDPAVVLVSGLGGQLILWPYGFVHALTVAGYRVIRFDNRDVGLSTHLGGGKVNLSAVAAAVRTGSVPQVPYLLGDMAADTVGLMDHAGVRRAHVAGVSMGGAIVQEIAIDHPDRVLTLTSIMGTTGAPDVGQPNATGSRALFRAPPLDRDGAIESMVSAAELLASHPYFDPVRTRIQAAWEHDRAFDPEGIGRQLGAIWASGDRTERLRSVTAPALVIHGDADPLVDVSGGRATAAAIPGADYVEIEGMAHDLNERFWPEILGPLIRHLGRA